MWHWFECLIPYVLQIFIHKCDCASVSLKIILCLHVIHICICMWLYRLFYFNSTYFTYDTFMWLKLYIRLLLLVDGWIDGWKIVWPLEIAERNIVKMSPNPLSSDHKCNGFLFWLFFSSCPVCVSFKCAAVLYRFILPRKIALPSRSFLLMIFTWISFVFGNFGHDLFGGEKTFMYVCWLTHTSYDIYIFLFFPFFKIFKGGLFSFFHVFNSSSFVNVHFFVRFFPWFYSIMFYLFQ